MLHSASAQSIYSSQVLTNKWNFAFYFLRIHSSCNVEVKVATESMAFFMLFTWLYIIEQLGGDGGSEPRLTAYELFTIFTLTLTIITRDMPNCYYIEKNHFPSNNSHMNQTVCLF
jgi:hypothetical protein